MDFSDRLACIMQIKGLNNNQLSQLLGLHHEFIRTYLNGSRKPKRDMIFKMAQALQLSSFLLDDNDFGVLFLETEGNMIALIMELIKLNLITVTGKRDKTGHIKPGLFTMHLTKQLAVYFLHNSDGSNPLWDTKLYSKENPYYGLRLNRKDYPELEDHLINWLFLYENGSKEEADRLQLECALTLRHSTTQKTPDA